MKNTMKTEITTKASQTDVELFDQAFNTACALYGPMGFESPCRGFLYNLDMQIELLPFWERGQETPIEYAIRSAYEAGRSKGLKEAQLKGP